MRMKENIRLWNVKDKRRVVKVEAVIDTGAVSIILPKRIVEDLKLSKIGRVKVKYDERIAKKELFGVLMVEIKGRVTPTNAIMEPRRKTPLIGSHILEILDLWIDAKKGRVMPNPESPDILLLEAERNLKLRI